ncbi:hypothetical protein GGX14DRAFT_651708 [Mycena pura]|uniref:Uncharacterized protein n=1 Tax=Mycena pura TaxID=153505 RepID=A0AAD6V844_9AGAR|nr:hypothetical protein GGX14DRAFT_651708 [Mycena pura]
MEGDTATETELETGTKDGEIHAPAARRGGRQRLPTQAHVRSPASDARLLLVNAYSLAMSFVPHMSERSALGLPSRTRSHDVKVIKNARAGWHALELRRVATEVAREVKGTFDEVYEERPMLLEFFAKSRPVISEVVQDAKVQRLLNTWVIGAKTSTRTSSLGMWAPVDDEEWNGNVPSLMRRSVTPDCGRAGDFQGDCAALALDTETHGRASCTDWNLQSLRVCPRQTRVVPLCLESGPSLILQDGRAKGKVDASDDESDDRNPGDFSFWSEQHANVLSDSPLWTQVGANKSTLVTLKRLICVHRVKCNSH